MRQEVALVGVGNLGRAVLSHFADKSPSVAIVAAFDVDPALTDTLIHGVRCVDVSLMEALVRDLGIQIAVLTVPGQAAQDAAETLVRAGVKSIISFAPTPLALPNDIFVEYMDITAALESAAYFARLGGREEAPTNGDGDIEPMVKKLESLLARSNMKLEELAANIGANVVTPGKPGGTTVAKVYAGDRVSDLLNEASDRTLLVSNLASVQMLRVAELMDVPGICFVNGIEPDAEMIQLARDNDTLLMVSPQGVFETCGLIFQTAAGRTSAPDPMEHLTYDISCGDFTSAGAASRDLKQHLKRIGAESDAVRRAMIAAYEAEMNVVIHSEGGDASRPL